VESVNTLQHSRRRQPSSVTLNSDAATVHGTLFAVQLSPTRFQTAFAFRTFSCSTFYSYMSTDVLVTADTTLADLAWPIVSAAIRSATFIAFSLRTTVSVQDCERQLGSLATDTLTLDAVPDSSEPKHAGESFSPADECHIAGSGAGHHQSLQRRYAVYREWITRQSVIELGMTTFRRRPMDRPWVSKARGKLSGEREPSVASGPGAEQSTKSSETAAFDVQTFRFIFLLDNKGTGSVIPCFLVTPTALRQLSGRQYKEYSGQLEVDAGAVVGSPLYSDTSDDDDNDEDDFDDVDVDDDVAHACTTVTAALSKSEPYESATQQRVPEIAASTESLGWDRTAENVLGLALRQGIRYLPPRSQVTMETTPNSLPQPAVPLCCAASFETNAQRECPSLNSVDVAGGTLQGLATSTAHAASLKTAGLGARSGEWASLPPSTAKGEGAQLFRMLAESGVPLVFFDGLFEIMSMYEAFYAPLPPDLDAFIATLGIVTPRVVDVRCMTALMNLHGSRKTRAPCRANANDLRPGEALLALMVRVALQSASVKHRHLLESIRGGRCFVNHPHAQALRRQAQAFAQQHNNTSARQRDGTGSDASLDNAGKQVGIILDGQQPPNESADSGAAGLATWDLEQMLTENSEPANAGEYASMLLVPLARAQTNALERYGQSSSDGTAAGSGPAPGVPADALADCTLLNEADACELIAALEDQELPDDALADFDMPPQNVSGNTRGAALRAFHVGAVLAYLLERHGWSAIMDRFRGCISSGYGDDAIRLREPGSDANAAMYTGSTGSGPDVIQGKLTFPVTSAASWRSRVGGFVSASDSKRITSPESQADADRVPAEARDWDQRHQARSTLHQGQHAEASPPANAFLSETPTIRTTVSAAAVAAPTPTLHQQSKAASLTPSSTVGHALADEWISRLVSLLAPNRLTEMLYERTLMAASSIAQRALGAHSFAVGSYAEKTYLWESGLDVGVFIAGATNNNNKCTHTQGHVSGVTGSPRRAATPNPNDDVHDDASCISDAWPTRLAAALCARATLLAFRRSTAVPASIADHSSESCMPANAHPQLLSSSQSMESPVHAWMRDADTHSQAAWHAAARQRSRRRRRRRRQQQQQQQQQEQEHVVAAAISGAVTTGDLGTVEARSGPATVDSDASSSSCSGGERATTWRMQGNDGTFQGVSAGNAQCATSLHSPCMEQLDSICVERTLTDDDNAGDGAVVVRCRTNGLTTQFLLNPAVALCRSCFLVECDELIGRRHLLIRCLILLKVWWRHSLATAQARALLSPLSGSLVSPFLALLLLSYLNCRGLPGDEPAHVLQGLFSFYGFDMDWSRCGMSIYGPFDIQSGALMTHLTTRQPLIPDAMLRAHQLECATCRLRYRGSGEGSAPDLGDTDAGTRTGYCDENDDNEGAGELRARTGRQRAHLGHFSLNVLDALDPGWNIGLQMAPSPSLAFTLVGAFRATAQKLGEFRDRPSRMHLDFIWGIDGALKPIWSLIHEHCGSDAVLLLQRAFDDTPAEYASGERAADGLDQLSSGVVPAMPSTTVLRFWELRHLCGLALAPEAVSTSPCSDKRTGLRQVHTYASSATREELGALPDIGELKQILAYVRFLILFDTSEAGILAFLLQTLRRKRSLLVGELGQLLRSRMNKSAWQTLFKTRHGGLKRFLERYPDLFQIENDHPLNPHVSLRIRDLGQNMHRRHRGEATAT